MFQPLLIYYLVLLFFFFCQGFLIDANLFCNSQPEEWTLQTSLWVILSFHLFTLFPGTREKAVNVDFSDILPEEIEEKVKEAAEVSMGTEISEEDIMNIHCLCDQV